MIICTHNVWIDSRVACKGKLIFSECPFLRISDLQLYLFDFFFYYLLQPPLKITCTHTTSFQEISPRIFKQRIFFFPLRFWGFSWSVIDTIHTLLQKSNISFLTRPINHYIYASWISHEKRFDCSLWLKLSCVGVFWTNVNKKEMDPVERTGKESEYTLFNFSHCLAKIFSFLWRSISSYDLPLYGVLHFCL